MYAWDTQIYPDFSSKEELRIGTCILKWEHQFLPQGKPDFWHLRILLVLIRIGREQHLAHFLIDTGEYGHNVITPGAVNFQLGTERLDEPASLVSVSESDIVLNRGYGNEEVCFLWGEDHLMRVSICF